MRLDQVNLWNVGPIKELTLDMPEAITVITGPNGVAKSFLQRAIQAALFQLDKKSRDRLVSIFDPHTPPTATLRLRYGQNGSTAVLKHRLTDDTGEWAEGAVVLKGKGKALERIQQMLPLSAEAAARLLWGLQEDLADVIDQFPGDGHKLLTAAVVRGSGPDPTELASALEDEFKRAKRTGKDAGSLTRAEQDVDQLKSELREMTASRESLQKLQLEYARSKGRRNQVTRQSEQAKEEMRVLARLRKLIERALQEEGALAKLEEKQRDWDGLDDRIARKRKAMEVLCGERSQLAAELRVARVVELTEQINQLDQQIERAETASKRATAFEKKRDVRRRPSEHDEERRQRLLQNIAQVAGKLDATGLRYELSSSTARTIQIREDAGSQRELRLRAGSTHQGVVGKVVVFVDGLTFSATGKEDVFELKGVLAETHAALDALYQKFRVANDAEFNDLVDEGKQLALQLDRAEKELDRELKGSTLAELRDRQKTLESQRKANRPIAKDQESCALKHLGSSADIDRKHMRKDGEVDQAGAELRELEASRPAPEEVARLESDLKAARKRRQDAVAAFEDEDDQERSADPDLLKQVVAAIEEKQEQLEELAQAFNQAENEVTRLATDLRHAAPKRPVEVVEADLEQAGVVLHRERIVQEARFHLKEQVEEKILELGCNVPRELGARVGELLSQITRGLYGGVALTEDLAIVRIREEGAYRHEWQPYQLSCGERFQAALAVKLAVALALAEQVGPVFVILDDYLVNFDPDRRAAAEQMLIDLTADGRLQVVLLTCHTDWAKDWSRREMGKVHLIELSHEAVYYREPWSHAVTQSK